MREILFRGKRKDNGEWVYGDLVSKKYIQNVYRVEYGYVVPYNCFEVIPETVGQYTGLTDKNGKKIFEGDIIEHHVQGNFVVNRGIVNYDQKNARFAMQLNTMNPCFSLYNREAFEVIGNIYDNPELQEGEK